MKWLLFIGTVIIALIVVALQVWSIGKDIGPAEACVEQFMAAGQAHDIDSARALYIGYGQSQSSVANYIDTNYDALFKNYQDVEASGWRVDANKIESMDLSLSVINGDIVYSDGSTVSFNAGLARYEGGWKIWSITIGGKAL
ncbi:MAG: hypothetical protein WC455_08655 [Dehalococcoidia bacterium]|jgi:hypothetical protein